MSLFFGVLTSHGKYCSCQGFVAVSQDWLLFDIHMHFVGMHMYVCTPVMYKLDPSQHCNTTMHILRSKACDGMTDDSLPDFVFGLLIL